MVEAPVDAQTAGRCQRHRRQRLFHLFGGEGNAEHPYGIYADHDYYNPVTDTWHKVGDMPVAVHGVSGMAFIKGLIHFPGGGTTQGGSTGSVIHQVYKPSVSCK
jgi:hypothetical protein